MLVGHHGWSHGVTDSHPGRWHAHRGCCHVSHRTVRHGALHVAIVVVVIRRWWRLLVEDTEFVLFSLEILIAIVAQFAVCTRLMSTSMPRIGVSWFVRFGGVATYWARLSDRENALLQWGQTYGRS